MDWSNERYVRLYTRDTPEWLCLEWQGRALWPLLLRKLDRSGVLATKLGPRGVAVLVGLPIEVVEVGMAALIADGCLQPHPLGLVVPNFLEAQEACASTALRQRESRERRRAVTKRDTASQNVTNSHELSQAVTPSLPSRADPILAEPDPDLSLARTIPPAPEYPARHGMGPSGEPAVPAVSPAPAPREDIARTTPGVGLDPSTAGPGIGAHKPAAPAPLGEAPMLWRELETARAEVAARLGREYMPLPIGDRGERDLGEMFAQARQRGPADVATLVRQVRHAIAMAKAEVIADEKAAQWFTGAVFSPDNFRRLTAKPKPKSRPVAPSSASQPTAPSGPLALTAEDRAEMEALRARLAAGNTAGAVAFAAGQRAPPRSAAPTSDDTDDEHDEQPDTDEAT